MNNVYHKQAVMFKLEKILLKEETSALIMLGTQAFALTALTSLEIPKSVDTIGEDAFIGYPDLTLRMYYESVAEGYCIDNSLKHIVMIDEEQLNELLGSAAHAVLPDDIREIGDEAFAGSDVENVVLPFGCEKIGSKAFSGCPALRHIVIPNSVTSIDTSAFADSPNVVFIAVSGSDAENYAKQNGIPCIFLKLE